MTWLARAAGLWWFLATGGAALAESWIVAWKAQPYDSDASAKVFVCDRIQDAGEVTWYYKNGQKKSFAKDQFFRSARIDPSVPAELTTQEHFDLLKYNFARLSDFARQFPNAAAILRPRLVTMRQMVANFEAGKVYYSGIWMPTKEYAATIAKSNSSLHPATGKRQAGNPQGTDLPELQRRDALEQQRLAALAGQEAQSRTLAYAGVGGFVLYLVFLLRAMRRGLRKLVWLLLLLPCAAAGWLTYQEGGTEWAKHLQQYLLELPAHLKPPENLKWPEKWQWPEYLKWPEYLHLPESLKPAAGPPPP